MRWCRNRRDIKHLVEEHYDSLYRYAFRLSGSVADAEDLTQETFCQAQSKLGQLRDPQRARGWLFAILRNGYLRRTRTQRTEKLVSLNGVEVPERPVEDLPEIDGVRLQQVLNDMPESFRTPIILYYFEDFSYRDIAAQMDVPVGTVMSRLARAKAQLRTRLLQCPFAPPGANASAETSRNSGSRPELVGSQPGHKAERFWEQNLPRIAQS